MSNNNIVDDPAFGIDFNSKYDGPQVEELLDKMAGLSIDEALSDTSENPVQNKAVTKAVKSKQDAIEDLDVIRRGAARGATALQDIPSDYPKRTDFKTINNQSILGTGNIVIEAGSKITVDSELSLGSTNPIQNKVVTESINGIAQELQWLSDGLAQKMNLDVNSQTESTISAMQPDNVYIIANTSAGDVKVNSIAAPDASKLMGRYTVMFTGATSLTIPSEVLWADGKVPTIDPAMHYELSIIGARFGSTVVYKAILAGFKSV